MNKASICEADKLLSLKWKYSREVASKTLLFVQFPQKFECVVLCHCSSVKLTDMTHGLTIGSSRLRIGLKLNWIILTEWLNDDWLLWIFVNHWIIECWLKFSFRRLSFSFPRDSEDMKSIQKYKDDFQNFLLLLNEIDSRANIRNDVPTSQSCSVICTIFLTRTLFMIWQVVLCGENPRNHS